MMTETCCGKMTEPEYPKFHIANHIKIEETEYVNAELVPVIQFNISLSKEALQDHTIFWTQYFKEYNVYSHKQTPEPEIEVKKQIIYALVDKFDYYLRNKKDV